MRKRKRGGKGERWEKEGRSRDKNRKMGQEDWVSMHQWQRDHGEAQRGDVTEAGVEKRGDLKEGPERRPGRPGAPGEGGSETGGGQGCQGSYYDGSYTRRLSALGPPN